MPGVEALALEVRANGRVNFGMGQPKLSALLANGSVMAKRDLGSILALAVADPTSSPAALPAINAVLAAASSAGIPVKKSNLDADEVGG